MQLSIISIIQSRWTIFEYLDHSKESSVTTGEPSTVAPACNARPETALPLLVLLRLSDLYHVSVPQSQLTEPIL